MRSCVSSRCSASLPLPRHRARLRFPIADGVAAWLHARDVVTPALARQCRRRRRGSEADRPEEEPGHGDQRPADLLDHGDARRDELLARDQVVENAGGGHLALERRPAHLERRVEDLDERLVVSRDHARREFELAAQPGALQVAGDGLLALVDVALDDGRRTLRQRVRGNFAQLRRAAARDRGQHAREREHAAARHGSGRVHGGCHANTLDSTRSSGLASPAGTPVCDGLDKATSSLEPPHQARFFRSRRSSAVGRRRGSSPLGKIWVFWTFWVPVVGSVATKSTQPGALK